MSRKTIASLEAELAEAIRQRDTAQRAFGASELSAANARRNALVEAETLFVKIAATIQGLEALTDSWWWSFVPSGIQRKVSIVIFQVDASLMSINDLIKKAKPNG
jgi:hypothetical protein